MSQADRFLTTGRAAMANPVRAWRPGGFPAWWCSLDLQAGQIRLTAMTGVNSGQKSPPDRLVAPLMRRYVILRNRICRGCRQSRPKGAVDVGCDAIALKCVPRTDGALVHENFAVAS